VSQSDFFLYCFGGTGFDWGQGFALPKAGALLLEPHLQSFFALAILEMGRSRKVFAQAGLEP
jgi:hypothetical protein